VAFENMKMNSEFDIVTDGVSHDCVTLLQMDCLYSLSFRTEPTSTDVLGRALAEITYSSFATSEPPSHT
jgi:TolB-like protein